MSNNPRNPYPTVDVIIELENGKIVLIKRKNPPPGWALPGGFVDYGESRAPGQPRAADDAAETAIFDPHSLPDEMAFDHRQIIADYLSYKETGRKGRFTLPREE
ncbi:MAG: NUDIX hydrolase [Deltaproteobacteria bacterium]|nr:NUDIX hydrolase [Deltaproteobacteria bacterium]